MSKNRLKKGTGDLDPENLDTYFKKRMFEIGITNPDDHFFKVEVEHPGTDYKQPIFTENVNGNIHINYPSLYGGPEYIAGTETDFFRARYHPDNQKEPDRKYFQEAKSGVHIFHTPGVIEKFNNETKIKKLFVVEGEFKAYAGYLAGLDICGLGGKDLFKGQDGDLHPDLKEILKVCEVEDFCLLLDGDVYTLNWNQEDEPLKDLAKRLNSFYQTVVRFREVTKEKFSVKDVHFVQLRYQLLKENIKGLDDLLFAKKDLHERIIGDLLALSNSTIYFTGRNLTTTSSTKIKADFLLAYKKHPLGYVPEDFYEWFVDEITDKKFKFNGAIYQNDKEDGLNIIRHEDTDLYKRIGTNYIKIIKVPNSKRIMEMRRIAWDKGTLSEDYVKKGYTSFIDDIDKYDAFCNVPNNTETYEQVINQCFNLYFKLEHKVEEGDFPTISKFLKHIFGEKPIGDGGSTNLDMALDCLQLKYLNPTQKLPILCLVSEENNTGKSTFLWFMRDLFQENATVMGNQEINDQYNDDWASKAVIGIDEGFIEKKVILEKIKSQSTNDKIKLRALYAGRTDVSFFGWFILTSNDEKNFAAISQKEIRFWVNKVPVYKEEDPHMREKMKNEIPAFLFYLKHRKMVHEEKTRFWFATELMDNEALKKLKENSRGWFAGEIKEIITELFFKFKHDTLYYTISEISDMVNGPNSGVRFRKNAIRNDLEEKFGLRPRNGRYQQPNDPDVPNNALTSEKHGRCYEFRIEDFLTEDEIRTELHEYIDYDKIHGKRSIEIKEVFKQLPANNIEFRPPAPGETTEEVF
jgi:hypothetical protein